MSVRCLKVAFGMEDDGKLIDAHYGDSEFFAIYEVCEDGRVRLIEKRPNRAKDFEEEHEDGHGDPRKFKAVVSQLLDVDVLAAFRMGPNFLRIRDKTNKVAHEDEGLKARPSARCGKLRRPLGAGAGEEGREAAHRGVSNEVSRDRAEGGAFRFSLRAARLLPELRPGAPDS